MKSSRAVRVSKTNRSACTQPDETLSQALSRAHALEAIINRSPAMVFLWRVAEGWPVQYASENVTQLGYTADDFRSGRVFWVGVTHPDDVPRLEAEVRSYMERGIKEFIQHYRLLTKTGEIRWMEDRTKAVTNAAGEITHFQGIILDVTAHKQAEDALRRAHDELETRVQERTTELVRANASLQAEIAERKKAEEALVRAKDDLDQKVKERTLRLRQLTEELTRSEYQERRRIADILHEHLQQQLCGMKFRTCQLKAESAEPAIIGLADRLINDLDQTIHLTRTLSSNLYPQVLSLPKVKGFIEWLAVEAMNNLGLDVKTMVDARLELASHELRIFVFDAIRELLLNVGKHSKVKIADVRVSLMANRLIRIQVKDAGIGCVPKQNHRANTHIGLFRIQERAESLGGRLEVVSQPGKGTCATLVLPRS